MEINRTTIDPVGKNPSALPSNLNQYLEEREAFLALIPDEWKEHKEWLESIYSFSETAFDGQVRESEKDSAGNPARTFSHSVAVAKILLIECREELMKLPPEIAASLVAAALLHDVGEDTDAFEELLNATNTEERHRRIILRQAVAQLAEPNPLLAPHVEFLSKTLNGVLKPTNEEITAITGIEKPHSDWIEIKNKFQEVFIELGGSGSVIIKAADKLSNMRTMEGFDSKRIEKMLDETNEYSLPLIKEHCDPVKSKNLSGILKRLSDCLEAVIEEQYALLQDQLH